MFLKYQVQGCVACWWVWSNVVSTLETLTAFVLHITQAGARAGGVSGELLQILASAPLRERAAVASNPSPASQTIHCVSRSGRHHQHSI